MLELTGSKGQYKINLLVTEIAMLSDALYGGTKITLKSGRDVFVENNRHWLRKQIELATQ